MIKKFVVFVILLFVVSLLSSCDNSRQDIDDIEDQFNHEYFALEDEYHNVSHENETLMEALSDLYDQFLTLYCYHDEADPDITERDAYEAIMKMDEIFKKLYGW